jgi:pimeloyl-ACP methyl ester carboxylesterase
MKLLMSLPFCMLIMVMLVAMSEAFFHHSQYSSSNKMILKATTNVITDQISLKSGISVEMMKCLPTSNLFDISNPSNKSKTKPPLIFIHGSFHASWCWAEHYMPYFAELGHPCYALSLRGTGGSFAGDGVKKVPIQSHVEDVSCFIDYVMEKESYQAPILISHSFGGLTVMKYLERNLISEEGYPLDKSEVCIPLSGVVLMCSVPPSGNKDMTFRFLRRSLVDAWKITLGLAMKKCITDEKLCRDLFFDPYEKDGNDCISDDDIRRIQGYFKRDTVATIDLMDLAKKLPSKNVDDNGIATFFETFPPSLVIGASDDFIVDREGVEETARYFGVKPTIVSSSHDVMLGGRWKNGAEAIQKWLEGL